MQPARSSFLRGLVAPFEGLWWLLRRPACWGLALAPTAIAIALVAALSLAGFAGLVGVEPILAELDHAGGLLHALILFVGVVAVVVLAAILALALAQPLAGSALEALAARREAELGIGKRPESSGLTAILRSLRVTLFGLLCTLPITVGLAVLTFFVPPLALVTVPLNHVVTSTMLAWDIVDYPLSLRSAGVQARVSWFVTHFPTALGMGVGLALLFWLPGGQLVLIGAGVAGATKLITELEGEATSRGDAVPRAPASPAA